MINNLSSKPILHSIFSASVMIPINFNIMKIKLDYLHMWNVLWETNSKMNCNERIVEDELCGMNCEGRIVCFPSCTY